MPSSRRHGLLSILLAAALATPLAHAGPAEEARAENAVRVLTEIMQAPDKGIPENLLQKAEAVVVVPDLVKAGLVLGGSRGKGLMAVRAPDGTWTNPSFVTMTGGSIGFQAGVQGIDVVLVFRTRRGADSVVNGKFTLGADASVAAGPVGRTASALDRRAAQGRDLFLLARARPVRRDRARRFGAGHRPRCQPGGLRRRHDPAADLRRRGRAKCPARSWCSATRSRNTPRSETCGGADPGATMHACGRSRDASAVGGCVTVRVRSCSPLHPAANAHPITWAVSASGIGSSSW